MKLEELLNKLLRWGWKPRGRNKESYRNNRVVILHITIYDCDLNVYLDGGFMNEDKKSFRELVSRESGLWQFVCQNDMVDKKKIGMFYEMFLEENGIDAKNYRPFSLVERLIIESALCDEDKLEDFLLNNINADE